MHRPVTDDSDESGAVDVVAVTDVDRTVAHDIGADPDDFGADPDDFGADSEHAAADADDTTDDPAYDGADGHDGHSSGDGDHPAGAIAAVIAGSRGAADDRREIDRGLATGVAGPTPARSAEA